MDDEHLSEIAEDPLSTGVPGLDNVLCGGLDAERLYLVEGEPGTESSFDNAGVAGVGWILQVNRSKCLRQLSRGRSAGAAAFSRKWEDRLAVVIKW